MVKIKKEDTVIFLMHNDISERESQWDGFVTGVYGSEVDICYLEGYKSRNDTIPFEKVVAIVDKDNGKFHDIGDFTGYFSWVNQDAVNEYIQMNRNKD